MKHFQKPHLLSWQRRRLIVTGVVAGILGIVAVLTIPFWGRISAVFQKSDIQVKVEQVRADQTAAERISTEINPTFELENLFAGMQKYDEAIADASSDDLKVLLLWHRATALENYAERHGDDLTDYILGDLYAADEISQSLESAVRIVRYAREHENDAVAGEYSLIARRRSFQSL